MSDEENFRRLHALVHTRSPGRHTPFAQCNLGLSYANGTGVAQDCKEAARLYTLAAAQGDANAQFNLGILHYTCTGVAQDVHEAVRLYTLAAAQGSAQAQYNLGVMHANGTSVAQDFREAARLYTLAAAQGNAQAQCNHGLMHASGQGGLIRNLAEAATWLRLAAAQGDAGAQSVLEHIASCPIHQPGMRVQVFGLTSATGQAVNGRKGLVQDKAAKSGRAAVLLDGEKQPTSISTTNLRKTGGL